MKRLAVILGLSVLMMTAVPMTAYASHSMTGGAECGTYRYDAVADMTKGRTDGMVVEASYATGCKSYSYRNLVGTGTDEAYDYSGQQVNCVRVGQTDVARFFEMYFDTPIDPGSVKVSCSRWTGGD